jgi:hypothetical protein
MENRTQELIRLLPYIVRDKLRYYLGYVNDRLIDLALEEGVYDRVREVRNEVDLTFLLRLLYGYFVVGFHNYEQMLGFFENKGVRGFQIGSTVYARQSSISREWRQVADELERLVNEAGIALYVKPTLSIDEVLHRIIQSMPSETPNTE